MSKILFLGQFASMNRQSLEPKTEEGKFYANTYHFKIIEILEKYDYDFFATDDVSYLIKNHDNIELVWSVYNRLNFRNSEIFVQSLCEYYNLKYIGAAPNIRAVIEDKSLSKQLAEHININTANWVVGSKKYPLSKKQPFNGPYFVKPRFGSASVGIDESCLCEDWSKVLLKANSFLNKNVDIIVEKFVDGTHYSVSVMNTINSSPIIAIPYYTTSNKKGGIITHSQKRRTDSGVSRHLSKNEELNKLLKHYAEIFFKEIQPCDYFRVDFLIDKKTGVVYFLEVNSLMFLGIKSGFVQSFLHEHFQSYDDIIIHILKLGFYKI